MPKDGETLEREHMTEWQSKIGGAVERGQTVKGVPRMIHVAYELVASRLDGVIPLSTLEDMNG